MVASNSTHTARIVRGLRVGPAKAARDGSRKLAAKKRDAGRKLVRKCKGKD